MSYLLSGFIGAFISVLITIHHQGVKEQCLLIEKWMNNLRDEVSKFIGLCEKLRLGTLDDHFFDQNNLSDTIASSYRVLLLLNNDPEQIRICELVDQLFILARDNPPKKEGISYEGIRYELFLNTGKLLGEHWKRVKNDLRYFSIPKLSKQITESVTKLVGTIK